MTTQKNSETGPAFDDATLAADPDRALNLVEQAAGRAPALIDGWTRHGNAGAINEVAERGSGALRKAARRALNVLKSRGIVPPERKRVASVTGPKVETVHEAWLLAPDMLGNLLIVIAARTPASRYDAAFVILHDDFGIHRVDNGELSQSQLKTSVQRMIPGGAPYKPVKIPVEWARYRVAQARRKHAELGTPEPLGLSTARALLDPVPAEAPGHPFDEEGLELSDDDARELAKKSAQLHALPEFRGWFPPRPAIDELLVKAGEAFPSEQPPPEQAREIIDQQIDAATDRFFSPQQRTVLTRLLKDSALSVLHREGETRALDVAATIKRIDQTGLITDPPHELPFLRAFFEKAVGALLQQGGGSLRIPVPRRPEQPAVEAAAAPEPPSDAPQQDDATKPETAEGEAVDKGWETGPG
jgi:hypothetical protein